MSIGGGNNPFGSLHRDVLDATPDDDAGTIELEVMLAASHVITTYRPGKEKLINELKDRAKGAIAAKALPVADLLYSKAIEVHADATLYGNRSMVKLSLGHFKEALEDADKSLSHDKTYGKAWFRKGQACTKLNRHEEAVEAYQQGLTLEPESKIFKELLDKAKVSAEEAALKANEPPPVDAPKPVLKMPVQKPRAAAPKPMSAPETAEEKEAKANEFRGYKVTADGRKTTFFNNDLDDEAKRLIGDIRPKKIEDHVEPEVGPAVVRMRERLRGAVGSSALLFSLQAGSSAWNKAGTWEARNLTEWGKARLSALLVGCEAELPNGMGVVRTTKIKDLNGDCEITTMRKKKKHLFDWSFTLEWVLDLKDAGPCKGTLTFPDVTPDCEGEYEASFEVDRSSPPAAKAVLETFVRGESQGLRPAIRAKVRAFVDEFNAME